MNIAIYYSDMKEPPTKYTKIFDHTAAIIALSPPPVVMLEDGVYAPMNCIEGTAEKPSVTVTVMGQTVEIDCQRFREAGHTSMSIGDVVKIDGKYWRCEAMGWILLGPVLGARIEALANSA